MSVRIEGVEEIIKNLAKTANDIKKAKNAATRAGGEIVAKELERQVPVSGRGGSAKLDNTVATSNNRRDKDTGENYVAVGFSRETSHRVHVTEFGSLKQSSQGFMTKTVNITANDVQKAMMDEVRKVLR